MKSRKYLNIILNEDGIMEEKVKKIYKLLENIEKHDIVSDAPETILETMLNTAVVQPEDAKRLLILRENTQNKQEFNEIFKILTNHSFEEFLSESIYMMERAIQENTQRL